MQERWRPLVAPSGMVTVPYGDLRALNSCLENPRDGGAWWAAIYGVAQSRTRLKRLSSSKGLEEPPHS